jgi:plasmid stabilization system protein ParE
MRVRFTRAAQRDLAQIHTYISQDSPVLASRFIARLIERSRQLADNPFEGRETDEPNARVIVARRLRYFISTRSALARFT